MADERVFLNDGGFYVSNTRVILAGKTYATANITSVAKSLTPASKGCAMLFIGVMAIACLGSLGGIGGDHVGQGLLMLLVCIGLLAAGIAWLRSLKPTYHVMLASSSGESQGLSSPDGVQVDRVVTAINDAIAHRG